MLTELPKYTVDDFDITTGSIHFDAFIELDPNSHIEQYCFPLFDFVSWAKEKAIADYFNEEGELIEVEFFPWFIDLSVSKQYPIVTQYLNQKLNEFPYRKTESGYALEKANQS